MKRRLALLALLTLAMLMLLACLAAAAPAAAKPSLTLKAASSTIGVNNPLKLNVTVVSATAPYEIRIQRKTKTGWTRVATATLVAPGRYAAYVTFTATGKRTLRAAFVTASGAVTAYSTTVTVTVK